MLRLLIKDITVLTGPEPKQLKIQIRWQGGATEVVDLLLPPSYADVLRYPQEFADRIRGLAIQYDDEAIAVRLNNEGLLSSTGEPFNASKISWIRFKHHIPRPALPEGTLSVAQVQQKYGVSMWVVYYWIETSVITAHRTKPGARYAITLTDEIDEKLKNIVANSTRIGKPIHSQIKIEQGAS